MNLLASAENLDLAWRRSVNISQNAYSLVISPLHLFMRVIRQMPNAEK